MRLALAALVLLLVAVAVWALSRPYRPGSLAWRAVDRQVAARFPDVPSISTDTLASRLASGAAPLLLDARTPEEYAISHLPGAVRVDPDASPEVLAEAVGQATRVVVYCSVGVRSGAVAERLRERGVEAANLEGSIFRWAGEGRPVVRGGEPVGEVHPYDAVWGRLLAPDLRADLD
ncbi:rhodanese-like domain-containing protein [Rubrivirga sp. IMCC43871]|uniref:rhodanese-like domain-containing protein n=1 Tax=Rubrivirga sp. IMCC43871 TaxID=3391575 RepID=UPI00398F9E8C